jgi:AcrR family transcriptional regulator
MARPNMSEQRRAEILEAAAAVIAERGMGDARVADIAARIGASPSLVLYYFPSKDALLGEALGLRDQQFFADMDRGLAGVESAGDRLRMLVDVSCPPEAALVREDNEWLLWLELWARARHDPILASQRQRMDGAFRSLVAGVVREGVAVGEFRDVDPERFALHLTALIDGLAIQVLLQDPDVGVEDMRGLCLDMIEAELGVPSTR